MPAVNFFLLEGVGGFIEVSGANTTCVAGTYFLSDEKAASAPKNSVWKLDGNDRYIFNPGDEAGWRIGNKECLTTNNLFYASKSISILSIIMNYSNYCIQLALQKKTS